MSMQWRLLAGLVLAIQCAAGSAHAAANRPDDRYRIVKKIPGPDGMWDYATVDSREHRLYLAQGTHISILDLARVGAGAWSRLEVPAAMWHGVVPIRTRGWILGTNGHAHTLTIFDAETHKVLKAITTSGGPTAALSGEMAKFAVLADPDALVVDPKTGLAAAVNGGSGDVALVNLATGVVAGTVHVGGKLEFAVADGTGRLYVNVESAHEIAVIDVSARRVVRRIPLTGCTEPKGLAYDKGTGLLVAGCDNGVLKFVLARSATVVATRKIGRGSDAVIVDARRHRAFVPSGTDAELSIFDIKDPRHITLVQTLATERGTRLGAVDERTGLLYLPSATLGAPIPPFPWPSAVPGTFHILVVSRQSNK